jgi:hypothetical protein
MRDDKRLLDGLACTTMAYRTLPCPRCGQHDLTDYNANEREPAWTDGEVNVWKSRIACNNCQFWIYAWWRLSGHDFPGMYHTYKIEVPAHER